MAAPESTTSPLNFALPPSVKGLSRVADVVRNRLSPQIRELMDYGHYTDIKEIIKTDVVSLT